MLLLEVIETVEEPRPLAAGDRHIGCLEELAHFGSCGIDHRDWQHSVGDGGQDVVLDEICGAASGTAAERGAAVVAALGATLEVRLTAHPGAALAVEQAAQDVVAERSWLVWALASCYASGTS